MRTPYTENQVPAVLYLEREDVRFQLDFSGPPDELDIKSRCVYIGVSTDVVHPTVLLSCRMCTRHRNLDEARIFTLRGAFQTRHAGRDR